MWTSYFADKTILITGGTGSFGTAFLKILNEQDNPKSVRVYSRGSNLQKGTAQSFPYRWLRFFIGDVRDKERLSRAMNGVDLVIHAAALTQVPACENNPVEAVKTNIEGTINVIDAAIDNNVDRVLALSTEQAVHPLNVYGATKMVAEKLFVQGNVHTGPERRTKFSCVRFAYLIGNREGVIPHFIEQSRTGEITLADEGMTIFWQKILEGIHFVRYCIERMQGGEIFVPKIPSLKIIDLAQLVAPEAEIYTTGIRPGDKLHEILITEDEARHAKEYDTYYVIEPEFMVWKMRENNSGTPLPEGFIYKSDSNTQWIDKESVTRMIQSYKYFMSFF